MIGVNVGTGKILPVQLIFAGKTAAVEPQVPAGALSKVFTAHSESHWATPETTLQFVERVVCERDAICVEHGLPKTSRCLLIWDVFYTHREPSVLEYCRKNNVLVLFVPANCTGFLQLCDVALNKSWKTQIESAYTQYMVDVFSLDADVDLALLKEKTSLAALRSAAVDFSVRAIDHINSTNAIRNGAERIGLAGMWNPAWKDVFRKLDEQGFCCYFYSKKIKYCEHSI
jgi:hypothetical protein